MSLRDELKSIVGDRGLVDPAETKPYETDWRDNYHGRAAAVVRPANTGEAAGVVKLLAERRIPIVPV